MLKGKTPLLIALGLGLAAGLVSWLAIKKREADVRKGWDTIPVVVARQDIPEGTVVTEDMIAQRPIPSQFVTGSVVRPEGVQYVRDQKVLVPLQKGDPLLWTQFETTKAGERLSSKVQKKARAVTIEASRTGSVGGWVRPNDHVDVIGTFRDPETNEQVAVTLMQNVVVLATGKITGTTNVNLIPEAQRDYSNVTLLLIPEEAEMMVLAAELGELTLSLRNEEDVDLLEERGRATIKSLMSGERTKERTQRRIEALQIIKGGADGRLSGGLNP